MIRKETPAPIDMILHCPECWERHIDVEMADKPHHTHACQHCGLTWRPAVVDTRGVQFLPGFKDVEPLRTLGWTIVDDPRVKAHAIDEMSRESDAKVIAECGDDADKWARAFMRVYASAAHIDHDMMRGWFANAIESRSKSGDALVKNLKEQLAIAREKELQNTEARTLSVSYASVLHSVCHALGLSSESSAERVLEEVRSLVKYAGATGPLQTQITHLIQQDQTTVRNFKALQKLQENTQEQLDRFTGACADQTIQIMELRGEVMRLKEERGVKMPPMESVAATDAQIGAAVMSGAAAGQRARADSLEAWNTQLREAIGKQRELAAIREKERDEAQEMCRSLQASYDRVCGELADLREQFAAREQENIQLRTYANNEYLRKAIKTLQRENRAQQERIELLINPDAER